MRTIVPIRLRVVMMTLTKHPVALRSWGALAIVLLAITVCSDSRADARVPIQLQAQLAARVSTFDRNFQARAGAIARVLVLHKQDSADSQASATGFAQAIRDLRQIAGLPATVDEAPVMDGPALAARCRAQKIALVYLSVGLEHEMARLAESLAGVDVLTIGASAQYATSGAAIAFDLEESRPKLVLNLRSARAQNVAFKAELLKLARIVE